MLIANLLNVLLMLVGVAATAYTHVRLPRHTATPNQVLFTRVLLVAVGVAAGWVGARYAAPHGQTMEVMAFIAAFGLVHLPAAFILYSKRLRGVSR